MIKKGLMVLFVVAVLFMVTPASADQYCETNCYLQYVTCSNGCSWWSYWCPAWCRAELDNCISVCTTPRRDDEIINDLDQFLDSLSPIGVPVDAASTCELA